MKLMQHLQLIERVHQLIRRKATGSPKSLARRLNLSERQVYRLIKTMVEMGAPIIYSTSRESYCYQVETSFKLGFDIEDEEQSRLQGGWSRFLNEQKLTIH